MACKGLQMGSFHLFRHILILTGDGKGMQAMGWAGSKCWLRKDPNGIVEQMGVESTSRWGAFLRGVTPDRRLGDYQHATLRILNGIAKLTETTLQALPPGILVYMRLTWKCEVGAQLGLKRLIWG